MSTTKTSPGALGSERRLRNRLRQTAKLGIAIIAIYAYSHGLNAQQVTQGQAPQEQARSNDANDEPNDAKKEMALRTRLEFDPHDKDAYESLRELIEARPSYRAELEVVETWIDHNIPDWETMLHLDTAAAIGLDDPEEAIRRERSYLQRVARRTDSHTWDSVESWLAKGLLSRGHDQEALLHYRSQAVIDKEAGGWTDLARIILEG